MTTKQRIFSRDLIQEVNQNMIDGKSADLSGLPKDVQRAICEHRYGREEINRAFALAMDQVNQPSPLKAQPAQTAAAQTPGRTPK